MSEVTVDIKLDAQAMAAWIDFVRARLVQYKAEGRKPSDAVFWSWVAYDLWREAQQSERAGVAVAPSDAAGAPQDAIAALVARHAQELEQSEYTYFELAYTRRTEWMAWICSNHRDDDPNRKVIARGQGRTPQEACTDALGIAAPVAPAAVAPIDESEWRAIFNSTRTADTTFEQFREWMSEEVSKGRTAPTPTVAADAVAPSTAALQQLIERWWQSAEAEAAKRTVDAVGVAAGIRSCANSLRSFLATPTPTVAADAAALTGAQRVALKYVIARLEIASVGECEHAQALSALLNGPSARKAAHCEWGDECACGFDAQRVKEQCDHWVKAEDK